VQLRGYAICTQPRSGSNLLCEYLSSTDRLGHPLEYFNGPARRELGLADYPDDPRLQIDAILRLGATSNGVYAVKLFASQFADFQHRVRWTERLPKLQFVYLCRDDLLGQAISWARALQTEQYRSTQNVKRTAFYDAGLIRAQLMTIVEERARWEAFFARTGISPLRLTYERFLEDPAGHVGIVAALVDVDDAKVDAGKINLVKQRDALSEEWRQRFRAEYGDPSLMDDQLSHPSSLFRKIRSRLARAGARLARRRKM
jgi:LPS sulfotransferase NodH